VGNDNISRASLQQMLRAWDIQPYEYIESTTTIVEMMHALTTIGIEQMSLVTITLQFNLSERTQQSALKEQIEQSTIHFLEYLRSLVRKTDIVFIRLAQPTTFYFLLIDAALEGAEIVQTRLWDALLWRMHSMGDLKIVRPNRVQLGYSATTASCTSFQSCIEAAIAPQRTFEQEAERTIRKASTHQYNATAQEYDLLQMARKLGMPYLSLLPRKLPAQVLRLVDPKLAQELRCYPLGRNKDVLTVAIANPQDRSSLQRLEQITGMHIFPVLAPPLELQDALEQLI
jgi:hypothetical protein